MKIDQGVFTQKMDVLLSRIEALRPDLLDAAEALAYEGRSVWWIKRHYGERIWQELREFVMRNLWTQWRF